MSAGKIQLQACMGIIRPIVILELRETGGDSLDYMQILSDLSCNYICNEFRGLNIIFKITCISVYFSDRVL